MSVVTRRGAKTASIMLAGEDEVDSFRSWESVGTVEKMKSSEPPIHAIQAEILREVVFKLIFAL